MNKLISHKKKGTSLAIVFIVSAVILIMLATSFLVVGNYNVSITLRKKSLPCLINMANEDCQSDSAESE